MSSHLAALAARLLASDSLVVACHVNPDGDAIGSLLGMGLALQQLGKRTTLLCADPVPEKFRLLPLSDQVQTPANSADEGSFSLAIAVDSASINQLGAAYARLRACPTVLKIDHHAEGEAFGDVEWLEVEAAAVGEMLVELFEVLEVSLTPEIAQCLLTALVTDTGSFRFANTRVATFEAAAKLLATGVNFAKLVERIYWDRSVSSAQLTGMVMSRLQLIGDGMVAWSHLTNEDFVAAQGSAAEVDHLSNELRSIAGVRAAVLFRETPEGPVRVSLRSRGEVDVATVAQKFDGGGHRNASGCRFVGDATMREQILDEVVRAVRVASS